MIRPSLIQNHGKVAAKKLVVQLFFLSSDCKINPHNSRVGIKFADNSAIHFKVLYSTASVRLPAGPTQKLLYQYIPAIGAETGHSFPVRFVTMKFFELGFYGSNEPPVLCQSTFL